MNYGDSINGAFANSGRRPPLGTPARAAVGKKISTMGMFYFMLNLPTSCLSSWPWAAAAVALHPRQAMK